MFCYNRTCIYSKHNSRSSGLLGRVERLLVFIAASDVNGTLLAGPAEMPALNPVPGSHYV